MRMASGTCEDKVGQAIGKWFCEQTEKDLSTSYSAIGYFDAHSNLVGCAIFVDFNHFNIEVHFLGRKLLTKDKIKHIIHYVFNQLKCARLTIKITRSDKKIGKILEKIGFSYEGTLKHYYGLTRQEDALVFGMLKNSVPSRWL